MPAEVSAAFVERAVADFVSITAASARHLGVDGAYDLEVRLEFGRGPMIIRLPDPTTGWHDRGRDESIPISYFVPAIASLEPHFAVDNLQTIAQELALDCLSQAGASQTAVLRSGG